MKQAKLVNCVLTIGLSNHCYFVIAYFAWLPKTGLAEIQRPGRRAALRAAGFQLRPVFPVGGLSSNCGLSS